MELKRPGDHCRGNSDNVPGPLQSSQPSETGRSARCRGLHGRCHLGDKNRPLWNAAPTYVGTSRRGILTRFASTLTAHSVELLRFATVVTRD